MIMEQVKKNDLLSEIKQLQEKIDGDPTGQKILSLLETSKALDRQESELQSRCILQHAKLQTKVDEFEELLQRGKEGKFSENLDHTFRDSMEKLDSAKRELAANLRSTLSVKRQLNDVPSQAELIQYELRFSELYTHIQYFSAFGAEIFELRVFRKQPLYLYEVASVILGGPVLTVSEDINEFFDFESNVTPTHIQGQFRGD